MSRLYVFLHFAHLRPREISVRGYLRFVCSRCSAAYASIKKRNNAGTLLLAENSEQRSDFNTYPELLAHLTAKRVSKKFG